MIGLVGAQGVGKTTLGRLFAQRNSMPFVETTTSQVFRDLGFDPTVDYDLATRVTIQQVILKTLSSQYRDATRQHGSLWITDRTPIDMATYMLADVRRENCSAELSVLIEDYVKQCFQVAMQHFAILVLVQPGISVPVMRDGKAPAIPAYQEHFNALAMGLLMDERLPQRPFMMRRDNLDLESRHTALFNVAKQVIENHRMLAAADMRVVH